MALCQFSYTPHGEQARLVGCDEGALSFWGVTVTDDDCETEAEEPLGPPLLNKTLYIPTLCHGVIVGFPI